MNQTEAPHHTKLFHSLLKQDQFGNARYPYPTHHQGKIAKRVRALFIDHYDNDDLLKFLISIESLWLRNDDQRTVAYNEMKHQLWMRGLAK